MIIATTNDIYETTPTLSTGSTSGEIGNITKSSFSQNCEFTVSSSTVLISFGAGTFSILGIHGLAFGTESDSVTVEVRNNGTTISTYTVTTDAKNLVFSFTEQTFTQLQFYISGIIGSVTISYAAAGLSTAVPFNGVKPGQVLPYLQSNYATKSPVNSIGAPTEQRYRGVSSNVSLNFNNMPIDWVRGDLQDVFKLFLQTQIISMLDFEGDDKPEESWAAFQLQQPKATAYSGTRALVAINMDFRAYA